MLKNKEKSSLTPSEQIGEHPSYNERKGTPGNLNLSVAYQEVVRCYTWKLGFGIVLCENRYGGLGIGGVCDGCSGMCEFCNDNGCNDRECFVKSTYQQD